MVVEEVPEHLPNAVTVPLVVYVDGERKVIGEATVTGHRITARIDPEAGSDIINQVRGLSVSSEEAAFVFNSNPAPDPYAQLSSLEFEGKIPEWPILNLSD